MKEKQRLGCFIWNYDFVLYDVVIRLREVVVDVSWDGIDKNLWMKTWIMNIDGNAVTIYLDDSDLGYDYDDFS